MLRVVAYTPEPLLAMGLRTLFSPCSDVLLSATPSSTDDLRLAIQNSQPDVALISLSRGVDASFLVELRTVSPRTICVLWAEDISSELAHEALECGVRGVLRRSVQPETLLKCVRLVSEGELWFEKELTSAFLSGRSVKLSKREGELMKLLSQGLKNKEIAAALSITEGTVKVYLSKLYVKLGARDRYELALFGLRTMPYASDRATNTTPPRKVFVTSTNTASQAITGPVVHSATRVRA